MTHPTTTATEAAAIAQRAIKASAYQINEAWITRFPKSVSDDEAIAIIAAEFAPLLARAEALQVAAQQACDSIISLELSGKLSYMEADEHKLQLARNMLLSALAAQEAK